MQDESTKSDVKDIIEAALKDFSDVQVNLTSSSAREAIAIRIASDISSKFYLVRDEYAATRKAIF